jgi:hypothetical protein
MSREASLNPIFLMGKTCTSSLYHSFYLVNIEDKNELCVHFRFPKLRRDIEDVESGVKYFVTELDLLKEDNFGSFVVTTSDGSRFFASYRGSSSCLFVAVSELCSTAVSVDESICVLNSYALILMLFVCLSVCLPRCRYFH